MLSKEYIQDQNMLFSPRFDDFIPSNDPVRIFIPRQRRVFMQLVTLYQAIRCTACPLRCFCHKAKGERVIQVNHRLNELKAKARDYKGT